MNDFSVIIPHKNSVRLIERLLKSIPQCVSEIIVVDDNSTSKEKEKLVNVQKKFNFTLYENEGMFAGGARNTGIRHAHGKWLVFADSDDFFLENAETVFKKYVNEMADVIFFRVKSCHSDTLQPANRDKHINDIFDNYLTTQDEGLIRCRLTPPWSKMIKRDFVEKHQIWFEECEAGNDNWFSVNLGIQAQKIVVVQEPLYCVTISPGSITTIFSKSKFNSRFYSTLRVNQYMRKTGYGKYQLSVLYYIGKAYKFGIIYFLKVIIACFSYGANPLIGLGKITKTSYQIRLRENNIIVE